MQISFQISYFLLFLQYIILSCNFPNSWIPAQLIKTFTSYVFENISIDLILNKLLQQSKFVVMNRWRDSKHFRTDELKLDRDRVQTSD